jgi:YjbE family integral membrane protein
MAEVMTAQFWIGLMTIIWVNIILSGDNAVVIALAARSLPPEQQKKAVFWGAGAAVLLRIVLTIVAVELLKFPYLKLIGGALLLWIAVKLLVPEDDDGDNIESSSNLIVAIRTILIADLVMSLDNVIGVAAAAKGSILLLVLGLLISIPLVIFGATMLMKLMERWPVIITLGAAILGWVSGEMAVTDPSVAEWVNANAAWLHWVAPALGAILVVVVGKAIAGRAAKEHAIVDLAGESAGAASGPKLLVPVDGSESSDRAIDQLVERVRGSPGAEVHLLNVQPPLSSTVASHVAHGASSKHHQEEGLECLRKAREKLDRAGVPYRHHIVVGEPAETIARFAREQNVSEIFMGTRGLGATAGALMGSVAEKVKASAGIPVVLVK